MKLRRCQYLARQRDRYRTAAAQRSGIEIGGNFRSGREGALDTSEEVGDQPRRDRDPAIGEMLDDNGPEEMVVGTCDLDRNGRAQTGAKIGQRDFP